MTEKKSHQWRFMTLAIIFCVICMIYLGRLFYIQISGRSDSYDKGTTVRRVTVQAVRGEIYDRNGNALVSNRYTYDLVLSHAAFNATNNLRSVNSACLQMLEGLRKNPEEGKNLREEKFFPFDGAYPYYSYSEDAVDGTSVIYYRLQRVLSDLGMEPDTTVEELVAHYAEKYDLLMVEELAGQKK